MVQQDNLGEGFFGRITRKQKGSDTSRPAVVK